MTKRQINDNEISLWQEGFPLPCEMFAESVFLSLDDIVNIANVCKHWRRCILHLKFYNEKINCICCNKTTIFTKKMTYRTKVYDTTIITLYSSFIKYILNTKIIDDDYKFINKNICILCLKEKYTCEICHNKDETCKTKKEYFIDTDMKTYKIILCKECRVKRYCKNCNEVLNDDTRLLCIDCNIVLCYSCLLNDRCNSCNDYYESTRD